MARSRSEQQPPSRREELPRQASTGATSGGHLQLKSAVARAGDYDVQMRLLQPNESPPQELPGPVQYHGAGGTDHIHQAAAMGIQGGGGALPHADKIQQSFGSHDVSGIQAHTGSQATRASQAMGADAYATGNHIAFGTTPDLHTAAHEAAHVIQQQHGVSLSGGVGKAGDRYENHADAVADKVVKGESAQGVLSEMTGGASADKVQRRGVQRHLDSSGSGAAVQLAGDGTPGNNQAQNKQFRGAIQEIERKIKRKITKDERRDLHDAISGQDYGYQEIVDEGLRLFGGGK